MWFVLTILFLFLFFWTAYVVPVFDQRLVWICTDMGFIYCAALSLAAGLWTAMDREEQQP